MTGQGSIVIDKLEGAHVGQLAKKVEMLSQSVSDAPKATASFSEAMKHRLTKLINSSKVMLFMKGKPSEPECGFSRKMVALLNGENIRFGSFDILKDQGVRESLKTYSDWPTFPQLYVEGKLIGGLDIVQEMAEEGPLIEQLGIQQKDFKQLIQKAPVMVFMKGTQRKRIAAQRRHETKSAMRIQSTARGSLGQGGIRVRNL